MSSSASNASRWKSKRTKRSKLSLATKPRKGAFVSETILEHGYIPEEHAPDPVIGHGDPTPPGKVAIWLFLASEVMFFIGLLATYIIFRSGSPRIFAEHASALSK